MTVMITDAPTARDEIWADSFAAMLRVLDPRRVDDAQQRFLRGERLSIASGKSARLLRAGDTVSLRELNASLPARTAVIAKTSYDKAGDLIHLTMKTVWSCCACAARD